MQSSSTIVLRGGIEIGNALELTLGFVEAYPGYEGGEPSQPGSFDEGDLRRANRGGARISAAEIAAVLERRRTIERVLGTIEPDASLAGPAGSVPWLPLTRLFDAFGGIRGVGLSKTTKALHPKRPALIPILDSVVQAYLTADGDASDPSSTFGEEALTLVRSYKRDLDRNGAALRRLGRELAGRGHRLGEVRILDIVIWSVSAAT